MRKKPVMTSEQMEALVLPLIALVTWTAGLGIIGYLIGGNLWIATAAAGAVIGSYAAFGRSPLAAVLKWPAVAIGYGLTFFGGTR